MNLNDYQNHHLLEMMLTAQQRAHWLDTGDWFQEVISMLAERNYGGLHCCSDWDGMVISNDDPEWGSCVCLFRKHYNERWGKTDD